MLVQLAHAMRMDLSEIKEYLIPFLGIANQLICSQLEFYCLNLELD
jgi:hypothetical protein